MIMTYLQPISGPYPQQRYTKVCFTITLLERTVDVRCIQELLGHSSTKMMERYTYVSNKSLVNIKNPLDHIIEQQRNDNKCITGKKV